MLHQVDCVLQEQQDRPHCGANSSSRPSHPWGQGEGGVPGHTAKGRFFGGTRTGRASKAKVQAGEGTGRVGVSVATGAGILLETLIKYLGT